MIRVTGALVGRWFFDAQWRWHWLWRYRGTAGEDLSPMSEKDLYTIRNVRTVRNSGPHWLAAVADNHIKTKHSRWIRYSAFLNFCRACRCRPTTTKHSILHSVYTIFFDFSYSKEKKNYFYTFFGVFGWCEQLQFVFQFFFHLLYAFPPSRIRIAAETR